MSWQTLQFSHPYKQYLSTFQVGLGWIGDRPWISVGALYSVCLALCGACVAAMPPAAANFWLLAAVSCTFGLLFAGAFTFTPSLLVELVSLDQFTSAYGLVLLAQGIGHLIGPPLSGWWIYIPNKLVTVLKDSMRNEVALRALVTQLLKAAMT